MLDRQGIDARATIKSALLIENIGDTRANSPFTWLYDRRQVLIAEFQQTFSPQTAGVLIASLLGDKHFLDGRTAEVFRDGGTFHVLVISGLHITFIGGLAVWFVSLFSRRRILQFAIATAFLWAYNRCLPTGCTRSKTKLYPRESVAGILVSIPPAVVARPALR